MVEAMVKEHRELATLLRRLDFNSNSIRSHWRVLNKGSWDRRASRK